MNKLLLVLLYVRVPAILGIEQNDAFDPLNNEFYDDLFERFMFMLIC